MIIDGKQLAKEVEEKVKQKVEQMQKKPVLAVVLVGENPSSKIYVRGKQRACKRVGIVSKTINLDASISQEELDKTLFDLSQDSNINAILLQLPLPKHLNQRQAIENIAPHKDVDGLTSANLGALMSGQNAFALPCTPLGVVRLIKSVKPDLSGLNACIVGRSTLVGKPLAHMLLKENATVIVCHTKTKNLEKICKNADILIAAAGSVHLIGKKHIKRGAIVIDVGISKDENEKLNGDVDFEACKKRAGYITPVPGGVGPMTIAQLMFNVVDLVLQKTDKNS
jgi:methylenetetrahydrofolate dehydrogenase (NADP+)/methenyltetrahydrofolate cyclohydrolase